MRVKLLEQRHPDRLTDNVLERHRALAEGGERWHDLRAQWLPKNASEPDDLYADRLNRAVYHNYAGGIVGLLVAYLFSEEPVLEGMAGDWVSPWFENVDRRRTPFPTWWRQRFYDALVDGVSWAWVNLPARDGLQVASRADEERAGLLDAYLVPLTSQEVLDWGEDQVGALSWVVVRQIECARASIDSDRKVVWRWFYIDAKQIRRWEWRQRGEETAPKPDDEAEELPAVVHNTGGLPVVRLQVPRGLQVMRLLHDPAVAHLRARNDLSWALHRTAHAMPIIKRKWGGDDPTVGAGYYLQLEPEDEFSWTEPPGTSFGVLRDDCKDLKEELYRVVHQMALAADNDSSRIRSSGESKQSDWQASDIVMSGYADLVRQAMREVGSIVARIRGANDAAITAKGLDGWQNQSLEAFLASSSLAVNAHRLSPTFRREVAKREAERLLPDLSEEALKAIRAEIEDAPEEDRGVDEGRTGIQSREAAEIVARVARGEIHRDSGKATLVAMFAVTPETAEQMLGPDGFKAEKPEPPPGRPGFPPKGGPPVVE